MNNFGIIAAMQEEMKEIENIMEEKTFEKIYGLNFIKGKIDVGLLCNAYHYIICDTNAEAALPGGIKD